MNGYKCPKCKAVSERENHDKRHICPKCEFYFDNIYTYTHDVDGNLIPLVMRHEFSTFEDAVEEFNKIATAIMDDCSAIDPDGASISKIQYFGCLTNIGEPFFLWDWDRISHSKKLAEIEAIERSGKRQIALAQALRMDPDLVNNGEVN